MKSLTVFMVLCMTPIASAQQAEADARLQEVERRLDQAVHEMEALTETIRNLRSEISWIQNERRGDAKEGASARHPGSSEHQGSNAKARRAGLGKNEFVERIIDPNLGRSVGNEELKGRPEIFIQARYAGAPIRNGTSNFDPNFSLTRIETTWAGRVADRVGAGLELQLQPALEGNPEEIVNDAFIEYYLNDHATIRVGQFIKPFGFEIQQSSAMRESPERGVFAGYFFPGQRDRGVMLFGDFAFLRKPAFRNLQYFVGAFNGNRFFADSNRQLNCIVRVRKIFDRPALALGVSVQRGKQILPEGVSGTNDENLIGVDFQYTSGRVGLRGEFVTGNRPSTLLGIKREFAPAFRPGAHSSGGYLFAGYQLREKDNFYARYDQFTGDPVTGGSVRALNFGYFRKVGEFSKVGIDYQVKNRPSFNDDVVNGRLHIIWGLEF